MISWTLETKKLIIELSREYHVARYSGVGRKWGWAVPAYSPITSQILKHVSTAEELEELLIWNGTDAHKTPGEIEMWSKENGERHVSQERNNLYCINCREETTGAHSFGGCNDPDYAVCGELADTSSKGYVSKRLLFYRNKDHQISSEPSEAAKGTT